MVANRALIDTMLDIKSDPMLPSEHGGSVLCGSFGLARLENDSPFHLTTDLTTTWVDPSGFQ